MFSYIWSTIYWYSAFKSLIEVDSHVNILCLSQVFPSTNVTSTLL